jgi:seryl-tRNA synthetase
MLNATALAIGRIIIALLENYQRKNYIEVPEVLQKYLPFTKIE